MPFVETTYAIVRIRKKEIGRLSHYSLHFTRALIWRSYSIIRYMKTVFSCFRMIIVDPVAVIDAYTHPRRGKDAPPALLRPLRPRHWQLQLWRLTALQFTVYQYLRFLLAPIYSSLFSALRHIAAACLDHSLICLLAHHLTSLMRCRPQSAAAPPPPCF